MNKTLDPLAVWDGVIARTVCRCKSCDKIRADLRAAREEIARWKEQVAAMLGYCQAVSNHEWSLTDEDDHKSIERTSLALANALKRCEDAGLDMVFYMVRLLGDMKAKALSASGEGKTADKQQEHAEGGE